MKDRLPLIHHSSLCTLHFLLSPFLIPHLTHQKIVEARADDGDCAELADLIPTGGDSGRENVRAELKFEREGEVACECEADGVVVGRAAPERLREFVNGR